MSGSKAYIAIVGAGPAGLMAAEYLAQHGFQCVIYDAMPSPGRKFLMAGRGGLNLTHSEPFDLLLTRYPHLPQTLKHALQQFNSAALRQWADSLGAETFVGSSGRIFPKALKSSPLLRAWLRRLDALGVTLQPNHRLTDISANGSLAFQGGGAVITHPRAIILAMGGASWPRLGSTGAWRDILQRHGVSLVPWQPSNMGFKTGWSAQFTERFAGAPLKTITITHRGYSVAGEALITQEGLEGGAIYALSSALRAAINRDGKADIAIDLKPGFSVAQLEAKLAQGAKPKETQSHFLKRVAGLSAPALGILRESLDNRLPTDARALAQAIKSAPIIFDGMQGLDRAISSAGGVSFDAIDDHFMLKALPGIFVAGEMLDWDAPTGGYLLQASFATAVAAAKGVCEYLAIRT